MNPALDGVRAVAIGLVLACHTGILWGGWIGVDVFFVLSGYLITSILLNELRQTGDISLSGFYWRRAVRLLPALIVLVALPFVVRHRPVAWLILAAVAMLASSLMLWFFGAPEGAIRFGPATRPVGLIIGCALAFRPIGLPAYVAPSALAAIMALATISNPLYLVAPLTASLATAALIASLHSPVTSSISLLSAQPVRYIGGNCAEPSGTNAKWIAEVCG